MTIIDQLDRLNDLVDKITNNKHQVRSLNIEERLSMICDQLEKKANTSSTTGIKITHDE